MAKRKVVINNQELTPTVLAVKQDKKKSSIFGFLWVVFIFALLIGCVYYMQDISNYVKKYILHEDISESSGSSSTSTTTKPEEKTPTITTYDISDKLVVNFDTLKFSDFKINNNQLSFALSTNASYSIDLSTRSIFMYLFDSNGSEIQVNRILSTNAISNSNEETIYLTLKNNNVAKVKVVELGKSDYPSFIINTDANGIGTLTCVNGFDEIVYSFNNNKLYIVTLTQRLAKDSEGYEQSVTSYNTRYANYQIITGLTVETLEEETVTIYKVTSDLSQNDSKAILGINAFSKDTEANIVKFNLEANGYSCY